MSPGLLHAPRYCTGKMDIDEDTMQVKRPDVDGMKELEGSPTALTPSILQLINFETGRAKRVHLRTPEVQPIHWHICGGRWFMS